MRKALIEIRWDGPDKPIRALIEDGLDHLFMTISENPKVLFADAGIQFTARIETKKHLPELGARTDGSIDG